MSELDNFEEAVTEKNQTGASFTNAVAHADGYIMAYTDSKLAAIGLVIDTDKDGTPDMGVQATPQFLASFDMRTFEGTPLTDEQNAVFQSIQTALGDNQLTVAEADDITAALGTIGVTLNSDSPTR